MKQQIAVFGILMFLAGPASGIIINVPADEPTIYAGVQAANPGDVVLVAPGTYTDMTHFPPGDTVNVAVYMKSGVTVRGSGTAQTIVDADSSGHVFHCEGVTDIVIQDLTVRQAIPDLYVVGIYSRDLSELELRNILVEDCGAGGITLTDTSSAFIQEATLQDNRGKEGAGISIERGSSTVMIDCTLTGNHGPSGGGMFIDNGNATIRDCLFSGNFVDSPGGGGGGLVVNTSDALIEDCVFRNNISSGAGGGLFIVTSDVTMRRCFVHNNRTDITSGPGGGVFIENASVTLEECTITKNRTFDNFWGGGGVYVGLSLPPDNSVEMIQCTIVDNKSETDPNLGGGVTTFIASPLIDKSIVAYNTGLGIYCFDPGDNPGIGCSDVFANSAGDGLCGSDLGHNFSLDPLFCDMVGENYRLQMDSPCFPGNHPDGGFFTCDLDRIGAQDPGCNPADVGDDAVIPTATGLLTARPNPFTPSTTILFDMSRPGSAVLKIFDVAGREIRTLEDRMLPAGSHSRVWDGRNDEGDLVPSGVYFYSLLIDDTRETRRMVLTR